MRHNPYGGGVRDNFFRAMPTPPDDQSAEEADMFADEPEPIRALAMRFYDEDYEAATALKLAREQWAQEVGE